MIRGEQEATIVTESSVLHTCSLLSEEGLEKTVDASLLSEAGLEQMVGLRLLFDNGSGPDRNGVRQPDQMPVRRPQTWLYS